MTTLNSALKTALLFVLVVVTAVVGWEIFQLTLTLRVTSQEMAQTARVVRKYADEQTQQLRSAKNQKSIDAGLALAASAQGAVRLINTTTIPAINRAMGTADEAIRGLGQTNSELARLISDTNKSVNVDLLPAVTQNLNDLAKVTGASVENLNKSVQILADTGQITLNDIHNILGSEEMKQVVTDMAVTSNNIASTSRHLDNTAMSVELSAAQAPAIMESIERIARTTSRFTKATIIVSILSTIAKAFIP